MKAAETIKEYQDVLQKKIEDAVIDFHEATEMVPTIQVDIIRHTTNCGDIISWKVDIAYAKVTKIYK